MLQHVVWNITDPISPWFIKVHTILLDYIVFDRLSLRILECDINSFRLLYNAFYADIFHFPSISSELGYLLSTGDTF